TSATLKIIVAAAANDHIVAVATFDVIILPAGDENVVTVRAANALEIREGIGVSPIVDRFAGFDSRFDNIAELVHIVVGYSRIGNIDEYALGFSGTAKERLKINTIEIAAFSFVLAAIEEIRASACKESFVSAAADDDIVVLRTPYFFNVLNIE